MQREVGQTNSTFRKFETNLPTKRTRILIDSLLSMLNFVLVIEIAEA